jgi:hypothetical protein
MVTIATGEDMTSPKIIATEGHNNDEQFGDITDKNCRHGSQDAHAKVGHPPPPLVATKAFCSSEGEK